MDQPFFDRAEAGRRLADRLAHLAGQPDLLVLGLPRGGVPVAHEVASRLRAPLDVYVVRKLGVPEQPELAMGAIASGGATTINRVVVDQLGIDDDVIEAVVAVERAELERREHLYRHDRPAPRLDGRIVLLVDDGLATGSTMRAAVVSARAQNPQRVIVAVPVAPPDVCDQLRDAADEVVCLMTPEPFVAVGLWYEDFAPVSDEQIASLLSPGAGLTAAAGSAHEAEA